MFYGAETPPATRSVLELWLLLPLGVLVYLGIAAAFKDKLSWRALWALSPLAVPVLMWWWATVHAFKLYPDGSHQWAADWLQWFFVAEFVVCIAIVALLSEQRHYALIGVLVGGCATLFMWLGAAQQISGVWL